MTDDKKAKEEMMSQMLDDLDFDMASYVPHLGIWCAEICDQLIRKGWRKQK